jgi:hypothetical protein
VSWTKGPRGIIRIIPQKGDTWALYRNWSPDWNELTPDDVICKYEIAEVIDDFTEEQGLTVIPLLKVAGFQGGQEDTKGRAIPVLASSSFSSSDR